MTTEKIKVKREVEEVWTVDVHPDYPEHPCVRVFYPKHGCSGFGGDWNSLHIDIPPEVRAAAERLWQTIRPLQSGTSPDGSPWGEVRVEGEAPWKCSYHYGAPIIERGDRGYQAQGNGAEPYHWSKDFPQKTAAAWFSANPWPVKSETTADRHSEFDACKHGFIAWTCTACKEAKDHESRLSALTADRDAWKERAEKAENIELEETIRDLTEARNNWRERALVAEKLADQNYSDKVNEKRRNDVLQESFNVLYENTKKAARILRGES